MFENVSAKAIVYSFFTYSKPTKDGEKGLICISYLLPNTDDEKGRGWKSYSSWVNFSDELFNYLKTLVQGQLKTSTLEFRLKEDYRNSGTFIQEIVKINDFQL